MLFTYLACVFLTPAAKPTVKMVKKAFFELKKHGIPDAKVMAGVVLWVATTSFGERLGARLTFRLSAISPPVGGKSCSQSLF